jgi:hypothetical protein
MVPNNVPEQVVGHKHQLDDRHWKDDNHDVEYVFEVIEDVPPRVQLLVLLVVVLRVTSCQVAPPDIPDG